MTAAELSGELARLRDLMERANTKVRDQGQALAEAERDYRQARAQAWLVTEGTARQREDAVNAATAFERYRRDLADSERQAALEGVRNYRTSISALQTISNVEREEMALARTGPDDAA
jgi:hypothetical protein